MNYFSRISWLSLVGLVSLIPLRILAADPQELENPLGNGNQSLLDVIANLARFFISGCAFFAIIAFIWGGFLMLSSQGNPERITKGKESMLWAMIGMAAAIMSYSILSLFFDVLTGVDTTA